MINILRNKDLNDPKFYTYCWNLTKDKLAAKILSNAILRDSMLVTRDKSQDGELKEKIAQYKEEKRKRVNRNKKQGRSIQGKLAKKTGGKSVGTIEGQDISFQDKPWSVEAKHRKTFIGNKFMEQAEKNAPKGKTPLVIVHTKGQRLMKCLVLIRLGDWLDWYGDPREGNSTISNSGDKEHNEEI